MISECDGFKYKATDYYGSAIERRILWDRPDIGLAWPIQDNQVLSAKGTTGESLKGADTL